MFLIYDPKTDKYIALDVNSGGYPYQTEWYRAKFWTNLEEAIGYRKTMRAWEWEIHRVELKTTRVVLGIK